jgi:hypothetical protein
MAFMDSALGIDDSWPTILGAAHWDPIVYINCTIATMLSTSLSLICRPWASGLEQKCTVCITYRHCD